MQPPKRENPDYKTCKRCKNKCLKTERICPNCMEEFTPEADIDFNEGRM